MADEINLTPEQIEQLRPPLDGTRGGWSERMNTLCDMALRATTVERDLVETEIKRAESQWWTELDIREIERRYAATFKMLERGFPAQDAQWKQALLDIQTLVVAVKRRCVEQQEPFAARELAAEILHYLGTDIPNTVVSALKLVLAGYISTGKWVTETEALIGEQDPPLTVQRMQRRAEEADAALTERKRLHEVDCDAHGEYVAAMEVVRDAAESALLLLTCREERLVAQKKDEVVAFLRSALTGTASVSLRSALQALVDAVVAEAKAELSAENAKDNFSDPAPEFRKHEEAMLQTIAALQVARERLKGCTCEVPPTPSAPLCAHEPGCPAIPKG